MDGDEWARSLWCDTLTWNGLLLAKGQVLTEQGLLEHVVPLIENKSRTFTSLGLMPKISPVCVATGTESLHFKQIACLTECDYWIFSYLRFSLHFLYISTTSPHIIVPFLFTLKLTPSFSFKRTKNISCMIQYILLRRQNTSTNNNQ
jgi:hypothetical protein